MKDYTGIAPEVAVMFAEVCDIFPNSFDCTEPEFLQGGVPVMYEVELVIAHAIDCIATKGYCKSDSIDSTKDQVIAKLNNEPSEQAKAKAAEIVEWLKTETFEPLAIEKNCQILAQSGYAMKKHFGRLVYMPIAYDKYLQNKAREQQREAEKASELVSKHVGTVGEKIIINVDKGQYVTSFETAYSRCYLYKMVDSEGNVFVWFASSRAEIKDHCTVKATVKNHTERDGVKQTVITRCKVC